MANAKKPTHRYLELYEAMKMAVPDDSNILEVIRACEFIIADCIAQSDSSEEHDEQSFKAIADDIRRFTRAFKAGAKED
jgi:hypothetical protein